MDSKSGRIGALLERPLIEGKADGDTTASLTAGPGPGKAPFLLLEKARAALNKINEGR